MENINWEFVNKHGITHMGYSGHTWYYLKEKIAGQDNSNSRSEVYTWNSIHLGSLGLNRCSVFKNFSSIPSLNIPLIGV